MRSRASQRRQANLLLSLGVVSLGLVLPTAVRAQQPELNELASKIAQSLHNAKQKKVAVFDFVGSGWRFTELGTKLADDFSAALAKADPKLEVADRVWVRMRMRVEAVDPAEFEAPSAALLNIA